MRGKTGKMGILVWNAEGEVCPFEGQQIFFHFPLSTPLPLDTASNYPRKEILKLSTWAAFFLPESQLSTRERIGGNDEDS